jgi:chromosome segregation ATPase
MVLSDYLKGPEYKANAARLEAELQTHLQQSQTNMQGLQAKCDDLEAKARANAARLEAELQTHRQQSQTNMQGLQAKYEDLEAKAREIGLWDLFAVKKQIQVEEVRLASVRAQVGATQTDLEAARFKLHDIQQQILGAEDTVQLESFALY